MNMKKKQWSYLKKLRTTTCKWMMQEAPATIDPKLKIVSELHINKIMAHSPVLNLRLYRSCMIMNEYFANRGYIALKRGLQDDRVHKRRGWVARCDGNTYSNRTDIGGFGSTVHTLQFLFSSLERFHHLPVLCSELLRSVLVKRGDTRTHKGVRNKQKHVS